MLSAAESKLPGSPDVHRHAFGSEKLPMYVNFKTWSMESSSSWLGSGELREECGT
jgi:hypothetical protein